MIWCYDSASALGDQRRNYPGLGNTAGQGEKLSVINSLITVSANIHDLVVATRNVQDMARCQAKVFNPWETGGKATSVI